MVVVFIYRSARYRTFFCHDGIKESSFRNKGEFYAHLKENTSIRINLVPYEAMTKPTRIKECLKPLEKLIPDLLSEGIDVSNNPGLVTSLAALRRINGYNYIRTDYDYDYPSAQTGTEA